MKPTGQLEGQPLNTIRNVRRMERWYNRNRAKKELAQLASREDLLGKNKKAQEEAGLTSACKNKKSTTFWLENRI